MARVSLDEGRARWRPLQVFADWRDGRIVEEIQRTAGCAVWENGARPSERTYLLRVRVEHEYVLRPSCQVAADVHGNRLQ